MRPSSSWHGTPEEIVALVKEPFPEVDVVLAEARRAVPWCKREVWPWQAAVLALLAHGYDRTGRHLLEIGTALGYSAAVMALAAPRARITTLNPKPTEFPQAVENLRPFWRVNVVQRWSRDFLAHYAGPPLDLVFVDGDHSLEGVRADCGWWEQLAPGGLILFHDYSPEGSARPNPEVVQAVDEFGERLGKRPEVLAIDETGVGMAGFYKTLD